MGDLFARAFRLVVAGGLATAAISVGWAGPATADWLGQEQGLTSGSASQEWPQLSGSNLVYADRSRERTVGNAADAPTAFDIRFLDLATGTDRSLTPGHTALGRPAISGDRVVWSDYGDGTDRGIAYRNLRTGAQRRLATGPGLNVQISGKRLCYELAGRIHVYDLGSDRDRTVSPERSAAGSCDISGEVVVWQERRGGADSDIFALDLRTGTETRLTTSATDQSLPRIDGRLVVWQDQLSATNSDLYLRDLGTGHTSRITSDPAVQWFADLAAGRVVWMDERHGHGNTEIYLYDLASGVETRVTNHEGWTGNPTLDGNRVVYLDTRGAGRNLNQRVITPPRLESTLASGSLRPELVGSLRDALGRPVPHETVIWETSADGSNWWRRGSTVTAADGSFAAPLEATADAWLRARFAGTPEYPPATGAELPLPTVDLANGLRRARP